MNRLRIGIIEFTNLFPVFHEFKRLCNPQKYEFIKGAPSLLNRMIRNAEIDVSPSSSIEYLRHPELYGIVEGHSISCRGAVGSIFLFSKKTIDSLDGCDVCTSSQSETSVALLKILLGKFYRLNCRYVVSSEPAEKVLEKSEAYLLIGDDAMLASARLGRFYRYDLGELWLEHTGLPFTYALWIYRLDRLRESSELMAAFKSDLDLARDSALSGFDELALAAPLGKALSPRYIADYWRGISYFFGDEEKKGFELFGRYCAEMGLL